MIQTNYSVSSDNYQKKLFRLTYLFLLCFTIILIRLMYLQLILKHNFFKRSRRNFTRTERVRPPRGNIIDCNGSLLATNRPMLSLFWRGSGNRHLSDEQQELIELIGSVCHVELDHSLISSAERKKKRMLLGRDMALADLGKVLERFAYHHNLEIKSGFKRFYPNKCCASHVLGHLGQLDFDLVGKMGLEKILHTSLQGKEGAIRNIINSYGATLSQEEINKALAGTDIQVTLDLELQKIAENLFPEEHNGSLLLIDPKSGALKIVLSRPNFDPSIFLNPINHEQWHMLQDGMPFLNRAFNAAYPPASLFKIVTISAGIELGIISPNAWVECIGYYPYKGRNYLCNKRYGHGMLSLKEALAKSCNPIFYHLGSQLSINDLASYACRFGLGQKTGIVFTEKQGLIPTTEWKEQAIGQQWWQGETLSAAIGQSYLLVTPVQIARMIGSIFQGYLIKPRILMNESIEREQLLIRPSTLHFIKKSMKSVVKVGTGTTFSKIDDIKMYAKTGTAQVIALHKKPKNKEELAHAWFTCYFQYKDNDPLVLVIMVEHAATSRIPTSVAKRFLMKYCSLMHDRLGE